MRKIIMIIVIIMLLVFLPLIGQEAETKPEVKEEIKVVNIEVPVRVFHKGNWLSLAEVYEKAYKKKFYIPV